MAYFKKFLIAGAASLLMACGASAANIAVVGGKNDDAFWNLIKKGVDDARLVVEANGGKVNYLRLQTYDNFAPDVVQLIQTAISQKVDGLVIPNWVPEGEDPAIREAIKSGIKVILMNAGGHEKAKELGAINYVGSDEYLAGVAGGEYFAKQGKKNVICVNTVPALPISKPDARVFSTASPRPAAAASSCRCPPPALAMPPLSPRRSRRRCFRTARLTASSPFRRVTRIQPPLA